MLRKVVSALLMFVMLSIAAMQVMAAENEEVCEMCRCPANSGISKDIAVFEIKGIEKAFLIADILRNDEFKMLRSALNVDEMDLMRAKVVKMCLFISPQKVT